jgi:hypothetical protein
MCQEGRPCARLQEVHDGLVQAQAQRQQCGAQPQLLAARAAARPHRVQLHLRPRRGTITD